MKYNDALNFIYSRPFGGKDIGLNIIKNFLSRILNPEKSLKFIHIAGTNGKGSISLSLSNILTKAGYKVGVNISPYIVNFRERIQINQEYISEDDLTRLVESIINIVKQMDDEGLILSQFAVIVAISILYFKENNCDIVILEVGIGGRFDPTNFIENPLCSVISSISYDHQNLLGNSIKEITFEKAGIIKENCNLVVSSYINDEAFSVIKDIASVKNANLIRPNLNNYMFSENGIFIYDNKYYKILNLGEYICRNFIVSLEVIKVLNKNGFKINYDSEYYGLLETKLFGRMEKLSENPFCILDGCHNQEGITELCNYVNNLNFDNKIAFCSFSKDRDYALFLEIITQYFDKIYIVDFKDSDIFISSETIFSTYKNDKVFSIDKNQINDVSLINKDDFVCFCGSLYFVSYVRKNLNYRF